MIYVWGVFWTVDLDECVDFDECGCVCVDSVAGGLADSRVVVGPLKHADQAAREL